MNERAFENGRQAVTLSKFTSYPSLHTLAVLYAEAGKTAEAYQLLLQALEQKEDAAPDSGDWYVFGRLAEHYGMAEVARSYYGRVTPPPSSRSDPISTYELARRRLAALAPAATAVAKR